MNEACMVSINSLYAFGRCFHFEESRAAHRSINLRLLTLRKGQRMAAALQLPAVSSAHNVASFFFCEK